MREKTQPGRDEGVMEDRKAAPALRARLLRSYVPLRCVRTKVSPPALPHPSPAEAFLPHKFKSARGWIFVDVYSIIIAVSCWFYMDNCEEYGEKYFK